MQLSGNKWVEEPLVSGSCDKLANFYGVQVAITLDSPYSVPLSSTWGRTLFSCFIFDPMKLEIFADHHASNYSFLTPDQGMSIKRWGYFLNEIILYYL